MRKEPGAGVRVPKGDLARGVLDVGEREELPNLLAWSVFQQTTDQTLASSSTAQECVSPAATATAGRGKGTGAPGGETETSTHRAHAAINAAKIPRARAAWRGDRGRSAPARRRRFSGPRLVTR